ncbi:hypothetical protein C367_01677 [Cryptococcus neoformans Ze90-1]|nr:hypothetical protein C367_01677 [Cryptococcus neoformans var. grubii Ze90-1]
MSSTNAEASSSRSPLQLSIPSSAAGERSPVGTSRNKPTNETQSDNSPRHKSDHGSVRRTARPRTAASNRKIRTVPPSAILDPPTPPSPVRTPLEPAIPVAVTDSARHRRYPTYYSDSDSDGEYSTDGEPPWWTFTQLGMAKLRQKNLRHEEVEGPTEGESAKEDKEPKKRTSYFTSSRHGSKEGIPSLSSRIYPNLSASRGNVSSTKNHAPSIKLSNTQFFRKQPKVVDPLEHPSLGARSLPLLRTDSAPARTSTPTSPTHLRNPGMATLANDQNTQLSLHESPTSLTRGLPDDVPGSPRRMGRRQLTAPNFPRLFRTRDGMNSADDSHDASTDTDAPTSTRKARPRSSLPAFSIPESSSPQAQSSNNNISTNGNATPPDASPTRPKYKRKASHRLRINLPPPITQHFASNFTNGWPHAGSWQDALYGHYEEEPSKVERDRRSKSDLGPLDPPPSPGSVLSPPLSSPHEGDVESSGEMPASSTAGTKRAKSKRHIKRFQALAPPTPSGLGFSPRASTARLEEYPWGHAQGETGESQSKAPEDAEKDMRLRQSQSDRVSKELRTSGDQPQSLSRPGTGATTINTSTEGGGTHSTPQGSGWRLFGWGHDDKRKDLNLSWKKKTKRVLFLDARVTIYIRLLNLAVVVVALGLAITIRLNLIRLHLPGILGSSTTLIICYSSTTILHVLTAIYREYFGKPIGLWGLRSKMLWVCLDLLFVALWSSAMSLAINDLIATPLECTAGSAWWNNGLADGYAQLLHDLRGSITSNHSNSNTTPLVGVTHVADVTSTLGVTLPTPIVASNMARTVCKHQAACIALSLLALLLYGGNMVLSLFRIFETVRRTANVSRAVIV